MTTLEFPTPDPRTFDEASRPFAEAIADHYAIKKMIGRGGMGIVYLARDRRLERLVAIKTLPPQLAADPAVRERFLRETRTAGAMSHPNIVPIHGADEIDGHVFFVMGFVDGESLAAHVRAHGKLAPRVVAGHLRDVASALAHAHKRGIVHRDIKAENILIERSSSRALVTDFGIARLAQAAPLTATGQLLGTVFYVSPEQVAGEPIDARSDLYSLGVVGFLALTGQFPFDGELASAVLVAHVTKQAPPIASVDASVPAALAAIVDRCLAKRAADRFASADELLAALDGIEHRLDAPPSKRELISDTEAHAVWQRAAELQALTGIQSRPDPVPRSRDSERDRARTSGFNVDDVRIAAREAGIGEKYVEHVLTEHGLAPRAVEPRRPTSLWAGVPLDITRTIVVDGELAPRDLDRVLNTLRDVTGRLGTTTAKSRELAWRTSSAGQQLDVSVVPEKGRSTIRLTANVRRMAASAMTLTVAVGGGVIAPVAAGVLLEFFRLPAPEWGYRIGSDWQKLIAFAAGSLIAAATIPVGRTIVRRLRARYAATIDAIAESVAAKVRESVDEERPD